VRAAALVLIALAACQPEPAAPPPAPDGRLVFEGAGLCYACHGMEGQGTPRGPDLTDASWIHFDGPPSADSLAALIAQGVPHPVETAVVMPAASDHLTAAEVRAVAEYVQTF
jgi:mono/diheme cytochrome c family protein